MSYKVLFVLNALVLVLLGVAFVFVPDMVLLFLGVNELYVATLWASRFFGSALFALGLVLWFAKDADETIQRRMGWGMFISTLIGLVVAVLATFTDKAVIRGGYSWAPSAAYLLFALLYAFMVFLKPKMKE